MASPEISNPLGVIDELFASAARSATDQQKLPAGVWNEKAHFISALQLADEENFARVPCLNDAEIVENIAPFSLVRYRCLVQDVFEPELYSMFFVERDGNSQRLVTTKYRESYPSGKVLQDLGRDSLSSRGAYYCVPLPGETSWSRAPVKRTVPQPLVVSSSKRGRDEDVEMETAEVVEPKETTRPQQRVKTSPETQRPIQLPQPQGAKNSDSFGLNLPLPWEAKSQRCCPCIVKLYDEDAESLRLCETVEILGVLCVDPAMANLGEETQAWPLPDARNPSTALVPRLHGLVVRKLPFYHPLFPFSPNWLSEARLASAFQRRLAAPGAVAAARSAAIQSLQRALGGDEVAAEYILALMASRVYGHVSGTALGQWSMNLSHWGEVPVSNLFKAVSNLTPLAVHLQMTAQTLSCGCWKPRKDFDANRLVAGRLQLAHGTFLLLDETEMQPAELNDHAVRALQAISSLVSDQQLQCDFNSYDVQIPLEVNCMFVSKGVSILKLADLVLPLRPQAQDAQTPPCDGGLDASRFLLGLITRHTKPFRMPEQVVAGFSQDFAQLRQEFQEIGQRTVHVWRSLARAICFTHGEEELTIERWQSIMALERERLKRCAEAGILQK
mmetsp:Transcript_36232/g.44709  ORF Transcript_36232/g.44709 Transcript_36232/m.44709 type:complete len:615 (+) Transcript_36232:36-1880(+)